MANLSYHSQRGSAIGPALLRALGLGDRATEPEYFDAMRGLAFRSQDSTEFAFWYLRSECTSKYTGKLSGPEWTDSAREDAALMSFFNGELACSVANDLLVDPWNRPQLEQSVWKRARSIVSSLLGRFDYEEFIASCGFGPGASTGMRRKHSSQQKKWERSSHITAGALPYYLAFRRWTELPIPSELEIVSGNTVTTVPKSYKTDRTIAIEPDWNMFFQKGIGAMIRRRLQRHGNLVRTAQSDNRCAARRGAAEQELATIDMKAASDTISIALVEALVPPEWFEHLIALRSPEGRVRIAGFDQTVTYGKISSMGNGFTFELETLLFYALARAVCGKGSEVRVYGDDVIVPTSRINQCLAVYRQAGFEINTSKSFWEGPFRESCGGHYHGFVDVTPFYFKHDVECIGDAIVLHNHVLMWHYRMGLPLSEEFREVVAKCRKYVPKKFWGPWLTAGCLWADWDECTPTWNYDTQSYVQKTVARKHLYQDVYTSCGSYLFKLWVVDPDLEASRLSHATSRESYSRIHLDRGAWVLLPVRTA